MRMSFMLLNPRGPPLKTNEILTSVSSPVLYFIFGAIAGGPTQINEIINNISIYFINYIYNSPYIYSV